MSPLYKVELLDSSLTPITKVQAFVPLDKSSNFLEYMSKLSDYGFCKFRIGTKDPLFTQFGDIIQPFVNHVRVTRGQAVVWQGIIINIPKRTKHFIEVEAKTYLYLLNTVLVKHDASVTTGDGLDNYRTFSSGTMATAIQTILTEMKANSGVSNVLTRLSIGSIENPNYPANFQTSAGVALTGTWTFTSDITLQFDYRDVLYVLTQFANYSNADFEITNDFVFNFKTFIGNKQPDIVFEYGVHGAIDDYNSPLSGERMANELVGEAVDYNNQTLHSTKGDAASINKYGKIQGVASYGDVKNRNALAARLAEELRFVSTPDTELHVVLNDRAYPLGQYGLGDTITIRIKDHIINVNQQRRVVGIDVKVHKTGTESIRLITNKPRDNQ